MMTGGLWSITLLLPYKPTEADRQQLEMALEPFGEALSSFEIEDGKAWKIEVFGESEPDAAAVRAALWGLGDFSPEIAPVPEKDWVAESQRGLPSLTAGPFFIHGSHHQGKLPSGKIVFEIDAGMAFGTGRHETTRGCLLALARLAKEGFKAKKPLDVGTGTGILAFGMARLFKVSVIGGDNDKDSVRVARENAALNQLKREVKIVNSDGYRAAAIRSQAPFDLVCANILANPLIELAPSLAGVLARNGRAVLSGLLQTQEKDVLAAHKALGLELDFRLRLKDWSVLVLKWAAKPAAKKPAAKKKTAKKPATKKAVRKPVAKKVTGKKAAAGKGPGRKTAVKKSAGKKAAAKKTATKKTAARKPAARKTSRAR
ncbi:MAG TPA: 50S ribosomal protein L11 methyltransferase [Rhizomicrobium sp.]|nr:50S ribosomal protein L11 methyltransferase [Terriglobales bacterium]HWU56754.1 50S ribosomal protein L11 methyltransferase [Rhizomicrobium sp.]